MKRISFRELSGEEIKRIRQQVVRLKEMGKTGKEIEQLTGVGQSRVSEIWKAYQCNGEASLEVKKEASREFFRVKSLSIQAEKKIAQIAEIW